MKQKTSFQQHSFSMNAFIIGMSILVFLTICTSYLQYDRKVKSTLSAQAKSDLMQNTEIYIETISSDIHHIYESMRSLSIPREINSSDTYTLKDYISVLESESNKGFLGSLSFFPTYNLSEVLPPQAFSDQQPQLGKQNMEESIFYIDPVDPDIRLTICICVIQDGAFAGILKNVYSADRIEDLFLYPTYDNKGNAFVLDKNGNALFQPEEELSYNLFERLETADYYSGTSPDKLKQDFTEKKSGILHYSFDGNRKPVYAYYSPMGFHDLYIYNIVPSDIVDTGISLVSGLANTLIYVVILVFLGFIIFILVIQSLNNMKFKKSQEYLLLEKERYDTILNHSQGTIWEYYLEKDLLIKSDPDVGIHSGLSELPHFDRILLENNLIYPADIPAFEKFHNNMLEGMPEIYTELRAKDISGQFVWFSLSGITVYDKNNAPISVIGQTLNIDAQKRELEELRDNSRRDSLTRLYNRSSIEDFITSFLSSTDRPMIHAFFMVDVDDFKSINDNYGHIFGDAVLIELSSKLAKTFKGKHLTGRLGGDEFVVFLYDIPSIAYVKDKAEKIATIFEQIYIGDSGTQKISGSIGISIYPNDGNTFDELLKKADIALYHSKNIGKNCYSIYSAEAMSGIVRSTTIKEDPKENSYRHMDHSLIDSSIIYNTVEILFDARQLSTSIKMILALIGNYYDLGSMTIFEQSNDNLNMDITYEWTSDLGKGYSEHFTSIPIETADIYSYYKSTPNGIYSNNDVAQSIPYTSTPISPILERMNIKCLLQCAIYNRGNYQGFICVNIYDSSRSWTKSEIDSLTLLSKIIGAHILKLRTEEAAERISQCDPLTGAYNFFQFIEVADKLVKKNPQLTYAVVYTDINKFKFINDTYGYSEGDRVLIEFSKILAASIDEEEAFGRVSGDKFVALLKYPDKPLFLRRFRQFNRLLASIKKTDSDYFKLAVIYGLYVMKEYDNMSVNIDRANIARKSITDRHKTAFAFFDESMKSRMLMQKEIEEIMEEALRNEEFLVYYQPKFDLSTGRICGAEALVRWNRPGIGLTPPIQFVPIFEENGFIVDIDYYVFERVCRKLRSLLDAEKHVVPISVNFSRIHLKDRTLVAHLLSTIREYDIPASLLEIELTESAFVEDNTFLLTLLNEIHNSGFKLSMDDFGAGLSSLNLLRKFPFDVLKIDKEFFQQGTSTERERVVITNVVKMAAELNMDIVSEGVETEEQAQFLKSIHCPIAQGFYFEKPLTEEVFEEKYCK